MWTKIKLILIVMILFVTLTGSVAIDSTTSTIYRLENIMAISSQITCPKYTYLGFDTIFVNEIIYKKLLFEKYDSDFWRYDLYLHLNDDDFINGGCWFVSDSVWVWLYAEKEGINLWADTLLGEYICVYPHTIIMRNGEKIDKGTVKKEKK